MQRWLRKSQTLITLSAAILTTCTAACLSAEHFSITVQQICKEFDLYTDLQMQNSVLCFVSPLSTTHRSGTDTLVTYVSALHSQGISLVSTCTVTVLDCCVVMCFVLCTVAPILQQHLPRPAPDSICCQWQDGRWRRHGQSSPRLVCWCCLAKAGCPAPTHR